MHAVAEHKTANVCCQFLTFLSSRYRRAKRIHLVLDDYIIHKAKVVIAKLAELAGRIVLHFLPPYSPDDKVIERLWKQLHDHVTRNHRHRTIDSLIEPVNRFLRILESCTAFPRKRGLNASSGSVTLSPLQ